VDTIVCGGTEAAVCPYALVCQMTSGLVSTATTPEDSYRPFDRRANGYVPGEGGAIMIVERLEHAQHRKAPQIYAEIVGYGGTQDAPSPKPEPEATNSAGHRLGPRVRGSVRLTSTRSS
jgi:minimal PKS chain-length factor (CLF/KS beta)